MAKVLHEAMIPKKEGHTYVILTLFYFTKKVCDVLQPQQDMVSKKKLFRHNFIKSMHVLEAN